MGFGKPRETAKSPGAFSFTPQRVVFTGGRYAKCATQLPDRYLLGFLSPTV